MFKGLLNIIIFVLLSTFGTLTFAAGWSTPNAIVSEVLVSPTAIVITLDPAIANVNSCTSESFVLYNGGSLTLAPFQQAIYSAALAAKVSGALVSIFSSQCDTPSGYNKLDYINLVL